jgi:hypothetical protein
MGSDPMETTAASTATPQPLGPFARITGVFSDPKNTFADIVRRPTWLVPMLVLFVVWLALNLAFVRRVDWSELSKDQMAKSKFASSQIDRLSDAEKERVYTQAAERSKNIRYLRAAIGWPLIILITAGIYLGAYKLFAGARLNFATALAISAFGHLPDGLRELLGIPVTLLKDSRAIDPENFLASNPGAFLGAEAPTWQLALLAPLDIFSIWSLVLIAIGFSIADPKKLPIGKSLLIASGLYAFLIVVLTVTAWIFS